MKKGQRRNSKKKKEQKSRKSEEREKIEKWKEKEKSEEDASYYRKTFASSLRRFVKTSTTSSVL